MTLYCKVFPKESTTMNENPTEPMFTSLRSRSLGSKFFILTLLAVAMSLSGFFVEGMTTERASSHGVLSALSEGGVQRPQTVLGVRLADSYRSTRRSLHYIPLFLGLVFLTYFLFEVMTGRSVHPAQYALVGVAQIIFYLLLLSLAEHLGFDVSFLIAGAATVGLFAVNTEWVFRSRKLALRALAIFTVLYGFIYVLLRVEAYALLIGAIASFAAVAAAMYVTRTVDWYGRGGGTGAGFATAPAGERGARSSWLA
jgi:inner membrane protein involved in colicin E2 resistance